MFVVASLVLSAGCNSNAPGPNSPKTYPVTGTVVRADGSPFPGGAIQFHAKAKSDVTSIGDIDEKGHFSMRSITVDGKLVGTPEGEYEIVITPASLSQEQPVQSIMLSRTVVIRAGEKNELALQLDP